MASEKLNKGGLLEGLRTVRSRLAGAGIEQFLAGKNPALTLAACDTLLEVETMIRTGAFDVKETEPARLSFEKARDIFLASAKAEAEADAQQQRAVNVAENNGFAFGYAAGAGAKTFLDDSDQQRVLTSAQHAGIGAGGGDDSDQWRCSEGFDSYYDDSDSDDEDEDDRDDDEDEQETEPAAARLDDETWRCSERFDADYVVRGYN